MSSCLVRTYANKVAISSTACQNLVAFCVESYILYFMEPVRAIAAFDADNFRRFQQ